MLLLPEYVSKQPENKAEFSLPEKLPCDKVQEKHSSTKARREFQPQIPFQVLLPTTTISLKRQLSVAFTTSIHQ